MTIQRPKNPQAKARSQGGGRGTFSSSFMTGGFLSACLRSGSLQRSHQGASSGESKPQAGHFTLI